MFPMLRRLALSAVITTLVVPGVPLFAAPAPAGQVASGTVSGSARSTSGQTGVVGAIAVANKDDASPSR
jgi:hypothetical protein